MTRGEGGHVPVNGPGKDDNVDGVIPPFLVPYGTFSGSQHSANRIAIRQCNFRILIGPSLIVLGDENKNDLFLLLLRG